MIIIMIIPGWPSLSKIDETPNFFSSVPIKAVAMINGEPAKVFSCQTTQ